MRRRKDLIIVTLALAALLLAAGAAAGCGAKDITPPTSQIDVAKDLVVKTSIQAIQTGIISYVSTSGAAPPTVDAASLGTFVSPWPKNPWTLAPMKEGTAEGDFTYKNLGGTSYSIAGHLSDGTDYVRP
jgi:hypothetical protein